jgi:biopolymer transport protein TolR
MVTAPLINPGQIELPSIGKTSDPPIQPMEVSIQSDGSLLMRDRARSTQETKVSRDQLIAAIRQKQQQNPDQAVVIAADKDVRYEAVLEVMDMLQQNQVRRVGLLAKPRSQ